MADLEQEQLESSLMSFRRRSNSLRRRSNSLRRRRLRRSVKRRSILRSLSGLRLRMIPG
jgi:hypothetical protein